MYWSRDVHRLYIDYHQTGDETILEIITCLHSQITDGERSRRVVE